MLALLSLARSSIPIWAEFCGGISTGNVAKENLFVVGFIAIVGASGGLDNEFTLNLEEDMVGSERALRFWGK